MCSETRLQGKGFFESYVMAHIQVYFLTYFEGLGDEKAAVIGAR